MKANNLSITDDLISTAMGYVFDLIGLLTDGFNFISELPFIGW